MLELRAFGPVDLDGDGGDLNAVLAQSKRLALFTYLVIARPRGFHRRDTLLNLFWPQLDQVRGRKALSQSLFFLRRALPDGLVVSRGTEEVGVEPGRISCDVWAFEETLETEKWQEALSLYRGELLEGLHVASSPDFERWAEAERERFRELAAGAAWSLAMERVETGELVGAERAAQRAIYLVPTEESLVRDFVVALADAGDRAAATRFYEKFRDLLAQELEVEPAPETETMAASLRSAGAPSAVDSLPGTRNAATTDPGPPGLPSIPGPRLEIERHVREGPRHRRPFLAGVGLALLAIVILMLLGWPSGEPSLSTVPYRVAVLPFENRTADPSLDPMGLVAADWISGGLTRIDTLLVESTSRIREILSDGASGDARVRTVARATGAGLVVTGSFVSLGDSLEFRAQLVNPGENRILEYFDAARSERSAPAKGLGPMRRQITGRIALRLDDRVTGLASVKDPDPPDYEAYQAYLNGVDLFFSGRYPEAIQELDRAWGSDSSFVAPGIWVASAYGNMGQPAKQDSVIDRLEPHRSHLSPIEASGLDIMRAQLRGDNAAVYRIASQGLERTPTAEGRLFVGSYGLATNRLREAVQALQGEPENGPTRSRWLPFHRVLADALHALGEHEEELDAAREARERFPDRIEPFFWEARALLSLGRLPQARKVLEEGTTVPSSTWPRGFLRIRVGLELRRHGYPDEGEQAVRRGLAVLGDDPSDPDLRYTAARTRFWLGEYDAAIELLEGLVQSDPTNLAYDGYLGVALAAARRTNKARRIDGRLERWSEPYLQGQDQYWRAAIAAQLGDREGAVDLLKTALAQGVSYNSLRESEELRPLWNYPPFQALLEARD